MDIGNYIKSLRISKDITQEELGAIVGVQRAAVQKWESGKVQNLKRVTIKKLADYFNVPASSFISENTIEENIALFDNLYPIHLKKFPLLGEIACGDPIMCNPQYETFVEANADIKADFCLIAKGDSMINARIFDGDIVFIKEQPIVENGEIAAVIIDNEATLKRMYIKQDRAILRSENPIYDDIIYEKEEMNRIRILGKAVAFQSLVR